MGLSGAFRGSRFKRGSSFLESSMLTYSSSEARGRGCSETPIPNVVVKVESGLSLVTELAGFHRRASVKLKRAILGLPVRMTFSDGLVRTAPENVFLSLIFTKSNMIRPTKNDETPNLGVSSRMVAQPLD